jgi:uncharacterized protein
MFSRFMPTEAKFFDLFNNHADQVVQGGAVLAQLFHNYDSPGTREKHIEAIDAIEKQADRYTHETVQLLHKTFITPFDRDDIHKLISTMDDILDLCQDVAESLALYDIGKVTTEAIELADLSAVCCERVKAAVILLTDMGNGEAILKICQEIDRLESDADRVMRSAMSKLFRNEPSAHELIKMKAIYELLETITDKCEDVANIIEGVVLENA